MFPIVVSLDIILVVLAVVGFVILYFANREQDPALLIAGFMAFTIGTSVLIGKNMDKIIQLLSSIIIIQL